MPTDPPCAGCGQPRTNYGFPKCPTCKTAWPPSIHGDVIVREYPSRDAYARDAPYMAEHGFTVTSVVEIAQNAGCARFLTLGLIALVAKPQPHILVTYQKR